MRAVFPGKPQSKLQAVDTASWANKRLVAYISYNSLIVLGGPQDLIQTITHNDNDILTAVAIDGASGKIAVSTHSQVYIYKCLSEQYDPALRWILEFTLQPGVDEDAIESLSWGLPEEILIAGQRLTLIATDDQEPRRVWSSELASSIKVAAISHDASLIASTGHHDRLAKIWRRLFFGGDDEKFEAAYLAHPKTVTGLRWRGRPSREQHADAVLYTICADDKIRVWTGSDPHCLQILNLWGELDVLQALQPRSPVPPHHRQRRYAFVLDNWELQDLLESAFQREARTEREIATRMHLKEVASQEAEAAIIVDNAGFMSAWGLERIGHRASSKNNIINIAHIDGFNMMIPKSDNALEDYVQCRCFAGKDGHLEILAHSFDGRIQWLSCHIDQLFDPSPQSDRLKVEASFTGNSSPIQQLTIHDTGFISISRGQEAVVWIRSTHHEISHVTRHCVIKADSIILDAAYIDSGTILLLHEQAISVWSIVSSQPACLGNLDLEMSANAILALKPPSLPDMESMATQVVLVEGSKARGAVFSIDSLQETPRIGSTPTYFDLNVNSMNHHIAARKDRRGASGGISVLRHSHKSSDIEIMTTSLRVLSKSLVWKPTFLSSSFKSHAIRELSDTGNLAVSAAARSKFEIIDIHTNLQEHYEVYEAHQVIEKFCWKKTDHGNALLAVALVHKVLVYSQSRYGPSNAAPAWQKVCTLDLNDYTNIPLADGQWLDQSRLLMAAGNQMFIAVAHADDISEHVLQTYNLGPKIKSEALEAAKLCDLINSPLPIYHPTTISLLHAAGEWTTIGQVIRLLETKMKFFTDVDHLSPFLDEQVTTFIDSGHQVSTEAFTVSRAVDLNERISTFSLTYLTQADQDYLQILIGAFGDLQRHQDSLNSMGLRFAFRIFERSSNVCTQSSQYTVWRNIVWASLCSSQDILTDLVNRKNNGRLQWQQARESGLFMWLSDIEAVRNQFEIVARNEYTRTEEKNPIDCSLYYLALKKKSVLSGLWRMATWNREQAATMRLLSNNFEDPRWQTAALKNAYALLGRRRTEYAAAFFLLANHLKDACNVLASQLDDLQLALAVARVYEGDGGPILQQLVEERVLPAAAQSGNRWMAIWAYRQIGRRDMALRACVEPLDKLTNLVGEASSEASTFAAFDPSLASVYSHLRDEWKNQKNHPANPVSGKQETALVMNCSRMYRRMGVDIAGLKLVRDWTFTNDETAPVGGTLAFEVPEQAVVPEPASSMLADWTAEVRSPAAPSDSASLVNGQARKKVTEEPSTSSILDSFDF